MVHHMRVHLIWLNGNIRDPFVHEFKIFEIPILGYTGYIPFELLLSPAQSKTTNA